MSNKEEIPCTIDKQKAVGLIIGLLIGISVVYYLITHLGS